MKLIATFCLSCTGTYPFGQLLARQGEELPTHLHIINRNTALKAYRERNWRLPPQVVTVSYGDRFPSPITLTA